MRTKNALTIFTLYRTPGIKGEKRSVAVDPKKVTAIRETVTGSVVIQYPGKTTYEVEGPHKKVVDTINAAR